ncbi:hypothetical protein BGZ95_002269 [Linnemannia exigua]|uniref:Uncharacterized protein n=1 Tax=Linnemannia exigua TaxID=604196 RepID=A0AAD4D646_9FUNG|nr:hypothetical protein BGZ95_002269 [Linnemannia exigua]
MDDGEVTLDGDDTLEEDEVVLEEDWDTLDDDGTLEGDESILEGVEVALEGEGAGGGKGEDENREEEDGDEEDDDYTQEDEEDDDDGAEDTDDTVHDSDYDGSAESNDGVDNDNMDTDEASESSDAALYRSLQDQGRSDEHADDEDSGRDNDSEADDSLVEDGQEPEMLDSHEMYLRRFRRGRDDDPDPGVGGSRTGTDSGSVSASTSSSSSSSSRPLRYMTGLAGNNWALAASFSGAGAGARSFGDSRMNPIDIDQDVGWTECRYNPEHRVVRRRINHMYQLLGRHENYVASRKAHTAAVALAKSTTTTTTTRLTTSPASTPGPAPTLRPLSGRLLSLSQALTASNQQITNVSELMDLLIQTHLPQFWRYRSKDKILNIHHDEPSNNTRPRVWDLLTTCVDCGFKFKKQPIYNEAATERKVKAKEREKEKKEKEEGKRRKEAEKLERIRLGLEVEGAPEAVEGVTRKSRGPRKEVLAVALATRLSLEFPSDDEDDSMYDEQELDIPKQHPDEDFRPKLTRFRNSHLTPKDVDDIFNNNRHASTYDGNIDCIGMKEEGHAHDCPTNLVSSSVKATKLHFGWDVIVGFNHSAVPKFSDSMNGGVYSSPTSTPVPQPPPPPPAPLEYNHYPARSLLAAFCHLLPRDLALPQNQIRKLFTYFLWHPWFDCDYQAITIRKAYKELWPLFLLRDEIELSKEEDDIEKKIVAERDRRKRQEVIAKKKMLEEMKRLAQEKEGLFRRPKRVRLDSNSSTLVLPAPPLPPPQPLEPEPAALQALLATMTPHEQKLYQARIEQSRRLQMEVRFTTSFERGLRNHGVLIEFRSRRKEEYRRMARQLRDGCVLGPRVLGEGEDEKVDDFWGEDGIDTDDEDKQDKEGDDDDDDSDDDDTPDGTAQKKRIDSIDFSKEPTNPGRVHIFRAHDARKIAKAFYKKPKNNSPPASPTTTPPGSPTPTASTTPPLPKVKYPEFLTPRFFNNRMTRPNSTTGNPLTRIRREFVDQRARKARKFRMTMDDGEEMARFVLPEFMRVKGGENEPGFEDDEDESDENFEEEAVEEARRRKAKAKKLTRAPAEPRATNVTAASTSTAGQASTRVTRSRRIAAGAVQDMEIDMDLDTNMPASSSAPLRPEWTPTTRSKRAQQQQQQQQLPQQQQHRTQAPNTNAIQSLNNSNSYTYTNADINMAIETSRDAGLPITNQQDYPGFREHFISSLVEPMSSTTTTQEHVEQLQHQHWQQGGSSSRLNHVSAAPVAPAIPAVQSWMPIQQQQVASSSMLSTSLPGTILSYQSSEPAMAMAMAMAPAPVLPTAVPAAPAHTHDIPVIAAVSNYLQQEVNMNEWISDNDAYYDTHSSSGGQVSHSSSVGGSTLSSFPLMNAEVNSEDVMLTTTTTSTTATTSTTDSEDVQDVEDVAHGLHSLDFGFIN